MQTEPAVHVPSQVVRLSDSAEGAHLAVRSLSAEIVIDGPMYRTDLRITFANDLGRTIEGDLVFPLPPFAALCELTAKCGPRTLKARFRPRERAQAEYHRAVQAGKTAVLGESEGEDLSRMRIAPIEAGEDVVVILGLVGTMTPISDGHRLLLPLTYMPRYVENEQGQKPIENAAVQRPRPLTLAARADVKVSIRKGAVPVKVRCHTHTAALRDSGALLEASVKGVPLDRDLHLEILDRQTGDLPTIWVRHDPGQGPDKLGPTTAVALLPPPFAEEGVTIARSVILLVDRSGSMGGAPIAAAIRAVKGCLRALGPADRFNVIAFDDSLQALFSRPMPFTDAALRAADGFVNCLQAGGGTEASRALEAILDDDISRKATISSSEVAPADSGHRLRVVVMMTDGDVGSAENVLKRAKDRLIDTRLFVIGIGDSVNHAMLARLAELGSGTYTPVSTNEDLERALHKLKDAIDAPLLTGVTIRLDVGGHFSTPKELEPAGSIDLFANQPLLLAWRGALPDGAFLQLTAQRSDGEDCKLRAPVQHGAEAGSIDAETASLLWALLRNRRLTYRFDASDDAALEELGVNFNLANRRVALVGVHQEERNTEAPESVPVVLPLPNNLAVAPEPVPGTPMPYFGQAAAPMSVGGPGGPPPRPSAAMPAAPPPSPARPAPMPARSMAAPPSPMMDAKKAKKAPAKPVAKPAAKGSGGLLSKVVRMFSGDSSSDSSPDSSPDLSSVPSPVAVPPPPPPMQAPPPAFSPAAPAPAAASAASGALAQDDEGEAEADELHFREAAAAPRFSDDDAGLRALLLEQRADGLFGGEMAATVLAIAALVSRGHTARAGSFRAELRRTSQTLAARLATAAGDEKAQCALALALLRVAHGEAAPPELDAELAPLLSGQSLTELPGFAAAIRNLLGKTPATWWQTPLARAIRSAFLGMPA